MTAYSFYVAGVPVPKGRPRLGRGGHTYTPARTEEWENTIRVAFRQAFPGAYPIPAGCAVAVRVDVFAPGDGPRCKIRGDVDNFVKAALDALNEIAFDDDTQVVEQHGAKYRAKAAGRLPGMLIEVQEA